jgi:hypothetical protein
MVLLMVEQQDTPHSLYTSEAQQEACDRQVQYQVTHARGIIPKG